VLQLLGLGLYIRSVAQHVPDRLDFHQPHRLLSQLSKYEHLHRVFRLCATHIFHNIQSCSVSDKVKNAMRTLVCLHHEDWDGTLKMIEQDGGVAGKSEFSKSLFLQFQLITTYLRLG
jgi:hypothetical protein